MIVMFFPSFSVQAQHDWVFSLSVFQCPMLVQRVEPQGRRFTNFHYYYYYFSVQAQSDCCVFYPLSVSKPNMIVMFFTFFHCPNPV